jgi:group I intron endonuclease
METSLKRSKSAIYSAILNLGISFFKLEILEYCSREECIKIEQKYINFLKPEYNILKIPVSSLGRIVSDETKAKLSAAMYGRKHTEETRAKLIAMNKGKNHPMFGKNHSDESKKKITDAMPNKIQIEVTDLDLNTQTIYHSIREAARALNIDHKTISNFFRNKQQKPYKGRYIFTK